MLLTDYFRSEPDLTWQLAAQCGVTHGVIRLPEDDAFDVTDPAHWRTVYRRFRAHGITPVVVEPLPNALHDHIKAGDAQRDACVEKFIRMLPIMDALNIRTICFNFMAHIGWTRNHTLKERGGALVTGFRLADFTPPKARITASELWDNYAYFIRAALPYAERHNIRLALHPDDPPLPALGGVERVMISASAMRRAVREVAQSPCLGITLCQATFAMMGEDLFKVVPEMKDQIFFIHFRNVRGHANDFQETFHDNGTLPMARLIRLYRDCGLDVPIRVDHVPTMAGEICKQPGYDAIGRLYAIGYLRGLLEATEG